MITASNISSNNNDTNNTTNSTNNNSSTQQQQPPPLRCPRCDSSNTKFCYYNNYSLLQPRYFCKSCRRYWTKGGALRNVPIGGGCRKNKRIGHGRQRPTNSSSIPNHLLSGHGVELDPSSFPFTDHHSSMVSGPNLSLVAHTGAAPHDQHPHPLLYFNIPPPDHPPKEASSLHLSDNATSHGFFSRQLASYLPSSLATQYLSNVSSLNPMLTIGNYNHDHYLASNISADQQTAMHPPSHEVNAASTSHESGFKPLSLAFDNPFHVTDQAQQLQGLSWSVSNNIMKPPGHEQKLLSDHKMNQLNICPDMETQGNLMELGTSRFNSICSSQLRPNLHCPKPEESWPDQTADQLSAHNYWNHIGGWQDMSSGYNPTADHHHHPLL